MQNNDDCHTKYGNACGCEYAYKSIHACDLHVHVHVCKAYSPTMADSISDLDNNKLAATQPTSTNNSPVVRVQLLNDINHAAADTGDTMEIDDHDEIEEVDYESPATLAIKAIYANLTEGFTHQVDQLASEFYQEGLLETSELSTIVESMGTSSRKRAIQLLEAVMSKIRVASSNFDKFVRVLESHQSLDEIVQIVKKRYKDLIQEGEPPGESESSNFRRPPITKQSSSIISVGAEELQIEIEEIERKVGEREERSGEKEG